MFQLARGVVFATDAIAIRHTMTGTIRRCFLMGDDEFSGKNFGHRKTRMVNGEL